MNNNPMNPSPMNQNPMMGMPPQPMKKEGGMGSIIAIIVIVIILALGGLYYFTIGVGQINDNEPPASTADELQNSDDPEVQALMNQGTSDEIAAIDADVEATSFAGVDGAISDIEADSSAQ